MTWRREGVLEHGQVRVRVRVRAAGPALTLWHPHCAVLPLTYRPPVRPLLYRRPGSQCAAPGTHTSLYCSPPPCTAPPVPQARESLDRSVCWPAAWVAKELPEARLLSLEYAAPASGWEVRLLPRLALHLRCMPGGCCAPGQAGHPRPWRPSAAMLLVLHPPSSACPCLPPSAALPACLLFCLPLLPALQGESLPFQHTVAQLMEKLAAAGVGQRPVIFVCHRRAATPRAEATHRSCLLSSPAVAHLLCSTC